MTSLKILSKSARVKNDIYSTVTRKEGGLHITQSGNPYTAKAGAHLAVTTVYNTYSLKERFGSQMRGRKGRRKGDRLLFEERINYAEDCKRVSR